MKDSRYRGLLLAVVLAMLAACASPPSHTEQKPKPAGSGLKSRLTPETVKDAQQIKTKRFTVYYFGTAQGEYTADHSDWHGTVNGEVLYVERVGGGVRETFGPAVTLTLAHGGSAKWKGRSQTTLSALPSAQ